MHLKLCLEFSFIISTFQLFIVAALWLAYGKYITPMPACTASVYQNCPTTACGRFVYKILLLFVAGVAYIGQNMDKRL